MKISILCSDSAHPVNHYLEQWLNRLSPNHKVELLRRRSELTEGDFLFLVSCSEIIDTQHRSGYRHTLILHASDLPRGRGWSPHVWEIIGGADYITLSLLEAEDKVDSGRLWLKRRISVPKHALWDEINRLLFEAEIELMNEAVNRYDQIKPYSQAEDVEPSYYRRRTPSDSRVDPCKSLKEQFDLIRVCDPDRYPATFEMHGERYKIVLEKVNYD